MENEKEELKDKKEKLIEHLYLYYLDLLKEGNDTRNEGLSWIVREIFNLGKNVLISYILLPAIGNYSNPHQPQPKWWGQIVWEPGLPELKLPIRSKLSFYQSQTGCI